MKTFLASLLTLIIPFTAFSKDVAENADLVTPLLNGQKLPKIEITSLNGNKTTLEGFLGKQKSVLFFYRGGWCPFCNTQMGQLKQIEPKLKSLGFKLVGISTDSNLDLKKSIKEHDLDYELVSDFHSEISQAFGLAFFADERTTRRYLKKMKLTNPLQRNSAGQERLVLPVPAIYVIDEKGLVQFNYVNPNFKVRLNEEVLLKVAETIR